MSRPTNGNTNRGFTLVEVLVSFAAMAIGFVILWGMHFASLRMQSSDQARAEALRVADAALEWQRNHNATYPGGNATVTMACPAAIFSTILVLLLVRTHGWRYLSDPIQLAPIVAEAGDSNRELEGTHQYGGRWRRCQQANPECPADHHLH